MFCWGPYWIRRNVQAYPKALGFLFQEASVEEGVGIGGWGRVRETVVKGKSGEGCRIHADV